MQHATSHITAVQSPSHTCTHICPHTYTHTHAHTYTFYGPLGFCLGLPGWAGIGKVKPGR